MTATNPAEPIPHAIIEDASQVSSRRWRTRLWWLTGICIIIAIALTVSSLRSPGERIVVHFRDGHGIKAGDTLRYLGIDVGAVTEVHLAKGMHGVDVHIELMPEHKAIAVEGSRFWIERPRLRIGQVSGLETVIGAKYVGTIPGKSDAARKREFDGLDAPLAMAEQESIDVRVRFPSGEGLSAGDPVRYLGIDVGEVTFVELNEPLDAVVVGVRLVGSAQQLAKAGTQFWIERPRLDISEVRGLDTIVGGRYLAIEPARGDAPPANEFVGLPEAPPLARRDGSLELELEARSRLGLVRGAPITYRGLEVGRVADVGLASDGASVTVRVIVEPEYADLVRKNSVWWSTGGVKLDAGLTGFNVSVESFTSWLRGGIAFATPDPPGDKVVTGYRFGLAEKADETWLTWKPRIATGPWTNEQGQRVLPHLERIAASWQSSFLGITRRQNVQAWCLPLEGDRLCMPASFIKSAQAGGRDVQLEIAGQSFPLDSATVNVQSDLVYVTLSRPIELERWPTSRLVEKNWTGKSTLLVVHPELTEPMPLDASRASGKSIGVIDINREVPLHKSLEGAAVIDANTSELLGLLVSLSKGWQVQRVAN